MQLSDFSPENIHNFVTESDSVSVFPVGSYYFFNGKIKDFQSHDYDYVVLTKDTEYSRGKFHYSKLDIFFTNYIASDTKENIIENIFNSCEDGSSFVTHFLYKNICESFGFNYSDIEKYYDSIELYINKSIKKSEKYRYLSKIFNFQKENKSFDLTDRQLLEVYDVYKNSIDTRDFTKFFEKKKEV